MHTSFEPRAGESRQGLGISLLAHPYPDDRACRRSEGESAEIASKLPLLKRVSEHDIRAHRVTRPGPDHATRKGFLARVIATSMPRRKEEKRCCDRRQDPQRGRNYTQRDAIKGPLDAFSIARRACVNFSWALRRTRWVRRMNHVSRDGRIGRASCLSASLPSVFAVQRRVYCSNDS